MVSLRFTLVSITAATILSGCAKPQPKPFNPLMDMAENQGRYVVPDKLISDAEARKIFSGKTTVSYSAGHGTQVTYLDADGTGRLWYPGNRSVLPNEWKIMKPKPIPANFVPGPLPKHFNDSLRLCFKYPGNTYNPYAGGREPSGVFNCGTVESLSARVIDSAPGDVFGLMQRTDVPFLLPKEQTTIKALLEKTSAAQ